MDRRTYIEITPAPGCTPQGSVPIAWQPADAANGNSFTYSYTGASCLVLARNVGTSPQTVTIYSKPDKHGRKDDFIETVPADGAILCFGPYHSADAFRQVDGCVWLDASSKSIMLAVILVEKGR